jgi:uncharacterized protein (TIGR02246 family)
MTDIVNWAPFFVAAAIMWLDMLSSATSPIPSRERLVKTMRAALILAMLLFAAISRAEVKQDEVAIRNILQEEVAAWNKGDAQSYSRHFATDGTFTNIRGMFFTGHQAFLDRHEEIFKGIFHGTVLRQDVVSLRFIRPDIAVVETLTWVSGFSPVRPLVLMSMFKDAFAPGSCR